MRSNFFLTLLILGAFGCQNSTEPTKTNSLLLDCYVRILESKEQILAQATLKSNGGTASLPVEIKGGIRYQGSEMDLIPGRGLTYKREYSGVFKPEHMFSWDAQNGSKRHTFTATMDRIEDFNFTNKKHIITLGQRDTCRWTGAPLTKGESIVFMWERLDGSTARPMEIFSEGNDLPNIAFPAAKLAELDPGKWSLYLVRKRLQKGEADGVPTQAVMEYYSQTDTFEVRK
jgi:hypothetical protein